MKKIISIMLFILSVFVFVGCNNGSNKSKTEVYTFSGENDLISVINGTLVLNGEEDIFSGGELKVLQEEDFSDVDSFCTSFYIAKGAEKIYILMNAVEDMTGATVSVSGDLGKISGDVITEYKDFSTDDFINNLIFELWVIDLEGRERVYEIQMNVEKVY